MVEVGAFEAKNTLGSLLDRVEKGEVISITRHGRRVARLVPNDEFVDRAEARAAAERILARVSGQRSFDLNEFLRDRDTGRR
jgi:prevent-host-death family protein